MNEWIAIYYLQVASWVLLKICVVMYITVPFTYIQHTTNPIEFILLLVIDVISPLYFSPTKQVQLLSIQFQ